ncbi:MAG: hypothetical protein KDA91_04980 [Planctomycetaceae bacterium]|nr:hypothetical protein [Planctomycetaceae bacterium]
MLTDSLPIPALRVQASLSTRRIAPLQRHDHAVAGLMAIALLLIASLCAMIAVWAASGPAEGNSNDRPSNPVGQVLFESESDGATASIEGFEILSPDGPISFDDSVVAIESVFAAPSSEWLLVDEVFVSAGVTEKPAGGVDGVQGGLGSAIGSARSRDSAAAQRWSVRFPDLTDMDVYVQLLDDFGIELGAKTKSGDPVFISHLSSVNPKVRRTPDSGEANRLCFSWSGDDRRQADLDLFEKFGLDVIGDTIVHFYPPELESQLAELELSFAGRTPDEIRSTVFEVCPHGNGFVFRVVDQKLR